MMHVKFVRIILFSKNVALIIIVNMKDNYQNKSMLLKSAPYILIFLDDFKKLGNNYYQELSHMTFKCSDVKMYQANKLIKKYIKKNLVFV